MAARAAGAVPAVQPGGAAGRPRSVLHFLVSSRPTVGLYMLLAALLLYVSLHRAYSWCRSLEVVRPPEEQLAEGSGGRAGFTGSDGRCDLFDVAYLAFGMSPGPVNFLNVVFFPWLLVVAGGSFRWAFGEVSTAEKKAVEEMIMNFAGGRAFFIVTVLTPGVHELVVWVAWYAVVVAFKASLLLADARLSALDLGVLDTRTTCNANIRALQSTLLAEVVAVSMVLFLFWPVGWPLLVLVVFDPVLLVVGIVRSLIHNRWLLDGAGGDAADAAGGDAARWDGGLDVKIHLLNFVASVVTEVATFLALGHLWYFSGISASYVDLLMFLSVQTVASRLIKNWHSFFRYRRAFRDMQVRFPDATQEELHAAREDSCAICRDSMQSAKKLPCGHLFHAACLHNWIKLRRICPICRRSLLDDAPPPPPPRPRGAPAPDPPPGPGPLGPAGPRGRGDSGGLRDEVLPAAARADAPVDGAAVRGRPRPSPAGGQEDLHFSRAARRLQQVFPHLDLLSIQTMIDRTGSVDEAVEALLLLPVPDDPHWTPPFVMEDDGGDHEIRHSYGRQLRHEQQQQQQSSSSSSSPTQPPPQQEQEQDMSLDDEERKAAEPETDPSPVLDNSSDGRPRPRTQTGPQGDEPPRDNTATTPPSFDLRAKMLEAAERRMRSAAAAASKSKDD